jgi:hypothetical protein
MAEHVGPVPKREPPVPSLTGRAEPVRGSHAELQNRRSETALAGRVQLLERRAAAAATIAPAEPVRESGPQPIQPQPANRTGLPDRLKAGLESLSGLSMDDVRVHRNSSRPARLGALAFAKGTEIHLGAGQEHHLPHEAWHVVQQKQERVRPTAQVQGDTLNDDAALEREADRMGSAALSVAHGAVSPLRQGRSGRTVQRLVPPNLPKGTKVKIIRSTSTDLHEKVATIIGPGERPNEYLLGVDGTSRVVIARSDQLVPAEFHGHIPAPSEADLSGLAGKSIEQVRTMIQDDLKEKFGISGPIVLGGSFATFLHAAEKGVEARTPRDIDLIMSPADAGKLKLPLPTFFGLPLDLRGANHVKIGDQEKAKGAPSQGTLLAAQMKKLRDDSSAYFEPLIPKPAKPWRDAGQGEKAMSAAELYEDLSKQNDRLMAMPDSEISSDRKKVWIKALADIHTLSLLGASTAVE